MLSAIIPKLPMRDKSATRDYYVNQLGFREIGRTPYPYYLLLEKDGLELHFFSFPELNPEENDGQVYIRVKSIGDLYQSLQQAGVAIHPNGALAPKPWGQQEFSLLDPDNNLLTFGEAMEE